MGKMGDKNRGPWHYEQIRLGFNYRMSDIHASLGLSQFKRLEKIIFERNRQSKIYDQALERLPIKKQFLPDEIYSSRHIYIIRVKKEQHKNIFMYLRSKGIMVNLHYEPIHLQPYFRRRLKKYFAELHHSTKYAEEAITLPLFVGLKRSSQVDIINKIRAYFK